MIRICRSETFVNTFAMLIHFLSPARFVLSTAGESCVRKVNNARGTLSATGDGNFGIAVSLTPNETVHVIPVPP
jgi:hypothetical protein